MTVTDIDIEFISRNHVGTYWSQLSHDHPVTLESVHKRKDGTTFPVEVRLGLLQLEGKQSILALARDITERKQAEGAVRAHSEKLEEMVEERTHELHEAQEQLIRQEKLAVLGQLAGGVGHELRNPLAVINNAVYYLKLVQPEASGKVKEYLGMIEKETHTAEKIFTDLLDFARIKSVDREPVAVPELVQRVLARFPAPLSVKVKFKLPTDLPPVFADPRQMEQVLGNLVVNAFQAMPQGGALTITATKKRGEIAIAVADTGVGIPPENMQKLFEPLFTTKPKGIGLGLAVSKKLVEANGGRIEVRSKPGKGATFTVNLPLEQGFQP
ncbi:MAG: PAS domain S-box protein [Chloroflexi bacterium]|nr:PAS domain S-box protein [Chloroflexota bacterium]